MLSSCFVHLPHGSYLSTNARIGAASSLERAALLMSTNIAGVRLGGAELGWFILINADELHARALVDDANTAQFKRLGNVPGETGTTRTVGVWKFLNLAVGGPRPPSGGMRPTSPRWRRCSAASATYPRRSPN